MIAPSTANGIEAPPARHGALILCLTLAIGISLGLLPTPQAARACSCPTPTVPEPPLDTADMVFDGTVTRVEDTGLADFIGAAWFDVTFAVHRQWKGVTHPTVRVRAAASGPSCGFTFSVGERYLVFAQGGPDLGDVNSCSRTQRFIEEMAAALGPPLPLPGAPPPEAWAPPRTGPCPECAAPPPPREALAQAAAVFDGRMVAVGYLGAAAEHEHQVTFENLGSWKGPNGRFIDVRVPWNAWSCDQLFGSVRRGLTWGEYLIYASARADGNLVVELCGRSGPFNAAEAAELGDPTSPDPNQVTATPTPTLLGPHPSPTPAVCPTLECPGCPGPRPAREWLDEAFLVFRGRVTRIDPVGCDHRVWFEALEIWKGPRSASYSVWVNMMSWQCTRSFQPGEVVLVFVTADGLGALTLPMCFGITSGDPEGELGPGTPVGGTVGTVTPVATLGTPTALSGRRLWLPWLDAGESRAP